jgi:hypothetical protein
MSPHVCELLIFSGVLAALTSLFYESGSVDAYFMTSKDRKKKAVSFQARMTRLKYSRVKQFQYPSAGKHVLLRGTEAAFDRYYAFTRETNSRYKQELIIGAAIKHPSEVVYVALAPGRHHHVMAFMDEHGKAGIENTGCQGFLTNRGRFIKRGEALMLARQSKQIIHKHPSFRELYSEDMW